MVINVLVRIEWKSRLPTMESPNYIFSDCNFLSYYLNIPSFFIN